MQFSRPSTCVQLTSNFTHSCNYIWASTHSVAQLNKMSSTSVIDCVLVNSWKVLTPLSLIYWFVESCQFSHFYYQCRQHLLLIEWFCLSRWNNLDKLKSMSTDHQSRPQWHISSTSPIVIRDDVSSCCSAASSSVAIHSNCSDDDDENISHFFRSISLRVRKHILESTLSEPNSRRRHLAVTKVRQHVTAISNRLTIPRFFISSTDDDDRSCPCTVDLIQPDSLSVEKLPEKKAIYTVYAGSFKFFNENPF